MTDAASSMSAPTPTADVSDPEVVVPDDVTVAEDDGAAGSSDDASDVGSAGDEEAPKGDSITEPAKVMRIGGMVKQLLEEVRNTDLDAASRERLVEVYERSIVELASALSPDLQEELRTLALPFDDDAEPTNAEIRIAKAQLVGWLEGLFHGIQASLMAQQFAAQQQLQQMRQLPQQGGGRAPGPAGDGDHPQGPPQTGTYL